MYQAVSDKFLMWNEDIHPFPYEYGLDFEAEVGVLVDKVPLGVSVEDAAEHIRFVTIINDISLRKLIPAELSKGFGFLQDMLVFMSVFGCIGAALGGYVGYRITRSKDK